jgi:hypothetical protein
LSVKVPLIVMPRMHVVAPEDVNLSSSVTENAPRYDADVDMTGGSVVDAAEMLNPNGLLPAHVLTSVPAVQSSADGESGPE